MKCLLEAVLSVFLFVILGLPLFAAECNVGTLQYRPQGSCGTENRKCCGGQWGNWGASKCECPLSTKPLASQTCDSCGTQSRTVTCDEISGNWKTGTWSSCRKTIESCCNSSTPKTDNTCYKDCTIRDVRNYSPATKIGSGRFRCQSSGMMGCKMQGPEESRCYNFPNELRSSSRHPGVYKCKYIMYTKRGAGTCEYSPQYCGNGHNRPPAMKSCIDSCMYGIGYDGRGDGTQYDEMEIAYELYEEKGRCKVPGW